MKEYVIAVLIGYAIGCIQPSYLLTRIVRKADIRMLGTGNAGASNTVGALGWKYGILVAVLDILKAIAAVWIVTAGLGPSSDPRTLVILRYLTGFMVIIGHNHPIYMRFRGGKGTASLIGMLTAIDIRIALICAVTIIVVTVVTDYIAFGAVGIAALSAVLTWGFGYGFWSIVIMGIITLLAVINHIPNFKRIRIGTEAGLRKAVGKK